MSQSSKQLWEGLLIEHFPDLAPSQSQTLLWFAASDWSVGKETELTDVYEKYRMLCALTDKSEISIVALS